MSIRRANIMQNKAVSSERSRFTPYESPLKMFRAYRYHPDFLKNVRHGYSSLTFINKTDPYRSLCEYEAGGGVCNDVSCQNQHFKDMVLSGASTTGHASHAKALKIRNEIPHNSASLNPPCLHTDFNVCR
jgi:hypothetical protein